MTRPAYLKIDQKYILRLSFWCSVRSRKEIVSNPFRATLHGTRTLYATASNTEGGLEQEVTRYRCIHETDS